MTFYKCSQKLFFLKEQVHIGQVSDSGAVDSRLHVYYSQIQLSLLIYIHLWSHWSLMLKQKQSQLEELQDFVQLDFSGWTSGQTTEKPIKCLCNQWGKLYEILWNATSLPVYSQELNRLVIQVCTFQANSCWLQPEFVPINTFKAGPCSLTLAFVVLGFFVWFIYLFIYFLRKEIEFVLKSYQMVHCSFFFYFSSHLCNSSTN